MIPLYLAIGIVAFLGIYAGLLVRRNNHMSLAHDLCTESLRQLNHLRKDRHELLPELIDAALAFPGTQELTDELATCLTTAQNTSAIADIGPAEEAVTIAVDQLVLTVMDQAGTPDRTATVVDLHAHLREVETHVAAAIRYYNRNVGWYLHMRQAGINFPLRRLHPILKTMEYYATDIPDQAVDNSLVTDTAYRPGTVRVQRLPLPDRAPEDLR